MEEIHIERLAAGGEGVGRIDGKVVFVSGGLPGERLSIQRRSEKRRYARADVVAVLEAADERRALDCPHESEDGCGGCGFRHVVDERSLDMKTKPTVAEMAKIAPEIAWPEPRLHRERVLEGSRQRVRAHVASGVVGLYQKGTRTPIAVPHCSAAHPDVIGGLCTLQEALGGVRATEATGSVLIERSDSGLYAVWEAEASPAVARILGRLVDEGVFRGARYRSISRPAKARSRTAKGRTVDCGDPWMAESARVDDRDLTYYRLAGTFGQANSNANRSIRESLHAALSELRPRRLLDLFAGSGNFSVVGALSAVQVDAIEADRYALEGLARTVRQNGLHNVRSQRRDLGRGLGRGLGEPTDRERPDVVLLDPPRTGALAVARDLVELGPRHIFYLSCSPAHLARDARLLSARYRVEALDAFDMFPRTPHLELLAHFRLAPPRPRDNPMAAT